MVRKRALCAVLLISLSCTQIFTVTFMQRSIAAQLPDGSGGGQSQVSAFDFLAASQLGYAPSSKKQFSSPTQFSSFVIRRVSDNATVFTGGAPLRSVQDPGVIGGATVWIGDFSSFSTPGRYKIVAGSKESYPFDIRADIYNQALRASLRFFYFQRSFTAIEQTYAEGPWIRPTNIGKAPAGVVKGWHDAGDLTVYNATMTQSLFWLLEAWSDFRPSDDNTNIPESGNGVPDLIDETRWGLEWLLSMQESGGGFWCNATAANGTNSYHYGTTFPNTVDPFIKTVPPTTQATAKAVAVLAYASVVYREFDQTFANRCLAAARSGWLWMVANPNSTNDGSPSGGTMFNNYAQGGDQALLKTNKMWAAAGMLYATGEAQYETAFQQNYESPSWISSYSKSDAFAATLYLRATTGTNATTKQQIRQQIFQMADGVRNDANTHPFQVATHYYWGATSNAMHRSGQFSVRAYLLDTTRTADRDQALYNLDWIFGRNYLNQVYLSGVSGASKPRLRGFHHWMKALNANPWHFPGALGGGPNQAPDGWDVSYPNNQPFPQWGYWGDPANPRDGSTPVEGRFTDNDSWSTNEVAINWNAAIVYKLFAARKFAQGGVIVQLPTITFGSDRDSLPAGGGNVTLTWTTTNALTASIDQGIGSVPLNGSMTVTVGQTKTFTLTATNASGSTFQTKQIRVALPGGGGNPQDITAAGTAVALITSPTGNGSRNIEVIRDGITPPSGGTNPLEQYDTYTGTGSRTFDWIGYQYQGTQTFGSIVFQEGVHASNGGWFSGDPKVQVRVGGQWIDVQGLTISPAYTGSSAPNFTTYTLRFNATGGDGIRIAGTPGGSAKFISVGELRVFNTGTLTVAGEETPAAFSLEQNYPNPFNPSTTIRFALPTQQRVKLSIFNLLGQEVRSLVDGIFAEGRQEVSWDGRDNSGALLSSGTYFYRIQAADVVEVRKMIMAK